LRKFHGAKIRPCKGFSCEDKKSLAGKGIYPDYLDLGQIETRYKKNRALTIAGSTLYNPKKPNENNLKLTLKSENLQI
jgi:hypothetical protein